MSHYRQPFLKRKFTEFILWPLQGLLVLIVVGLIRLLPVAFTSALCGAIISKIGPLTTHHKRARKHLRHALGDLDDDAHEKILSDMWQHFGRLAGEYPHIHRMGSAKYLTFHGLHHLEDCNEGGFVIGAHLGNWELHLMVPAMLKRHYGAIYRPLNNPFSNWVLDMRSKRGSGDLYAKGQDAARGMLKTIKNNGMVYLFTDQKYREGVMAPFLGHEAATPIGHIKIALKRKTPIFYMRIIRRQGCHYDVHISPPTYIYKDGTVSDELIAQHAREMNDTLSEMIRQTPHQWLWPHRRWGKDL